MGKMTQSFKTIKLFFNPNQLASEGSNAQLLQHIFYRDLTFFSKVKVTW